MNRRSIDKYEMFGKKTLRHEYLMKSKNKIHIGREYLNTYTIE